MLVSEVKKEIARLKSMLEPLKVGQVWRCNSGMFMGVYYYVACPDDKLVLVNLDTGALWSTDGFENRENKFDYIGMFKEVFKRCVAPLVP